MQHPTSSRSKWIRLATIPTVFLCLNLSACAEQPTAALGFERVVRTQNVPFNRFFIAWSQTYNSAPIETQVFALDTRQERQFAPFEVNVGVLAFAKANPGRLYINGDEIDQYCVAPAEYARMYHDFVVAVKAADPTARFSPSGFAEPNDHCCPEPVTDACRWSSHSVVYADEFYSAYVNRYGTAPKVDEWRFHDFGITIGVGNVEAWWARVDYAAAWSVAHGANMVLGAWGFPGWSEPMSAFQEHMKQAIGRISSDGRINGAVYWSYHPWVHSPHYLVNDDGSLTPEGQTFVNPLTDIPANAALVAGDGSAMLRWTNTTSAWPAETEFWVKAPGADAFVYHKTQLVSALGARETPVVTLPGGSSVKGRVRYYNRYGQAGWSSFSEAITIPSAPAETTKKTGTRKTPRFCFLTKGSC